MHENYHTIGQVNQNLANCLTVLNFSHLVCNQFAMPLVSLHILKNIQNHNLNMPFKATTKSTT